MMSYSTQESLIKKKIWWNSKVNNISDQKDVLWLKVKKKNTDLSIASLQSWKSEE